MTDRKTGSGALGAAAALGAITSLATIVLSVARSKTTAVILGPTGVGMTAEILQVVALASAPGTVLLGPLLVRKLANARAAGDPESVARLGSALLSLVLLLGVVTTVIATLIGSVVLPRPWGASAWPFIILAGTGGMISTAAAISNQMLVVYQRLKAYTLIGIATAAIQTALIVVGTVSFGLPGQFVALALAPAVALPVALTIRARQLPSVPWRPRILLDWTLGAEFLRFGGATLTSALGAQLMLSAIRLSLEGKGGAALNGQFQAAWVIASVYFGFLVAGLGNHAYPAFAAAGNIEELSHEVAATNRFLLRTVPVAALLLIALRAPIMTLLYSSEFSLAAGVVGIMAVADLARALVWVQQGVLLYRGSLRAFVVIELLGVTLLGAGGALGIHYLGLPGVGLAYIAGYLITFLVGMLVLRTALGIRLNGRLIANAVGVTLLLGVGVGVSETTPGQMAVLLAALGWAGASGVLREVLAAGRSGVARMRHRRKLHS